MKVIFDIIAIPFGYVMQFIYSLVGNYGLSIILFTILAKVVTLPLSIKSKKSMMQTQRLQPKQAALQKKYGHDKQKYSQEIQKLYDEEGVSPMSGCGTTLLTLPVMLGLYYVISQPLSYVMHLGAQEITALAEGLGAAANTSQIALAQMIFERFTLAQSINPAVFPIDYTFLGMNLSGTAKIGEIGLIWLIPILSGLTSFLMSWVQKKMQPPLPQGTPNPLGSMMVMMPLMSVYLGFVLPAGLVMYWVVNNLLSALQEYLLSKYLAKKGTSQPADVEPKPKKLKNTEQ